MSFNALMTDHITLVKQDGRRFDIAHAAVEPGLIIIDDPSVPVEEGDTIERALPAGSTEYFIVTDRGYRSAVGPFPAGYDIKVRRR
jgi:hypothetical protein